jgi:hypothetical protein
MVRQLVASWNALSLVVTTLLLLALASTQLADCLTSSALTTKARVSVAPIVVTGVIRTTASVSGTLYRSSLWTPWTITLNLSKHGKNEDKHQMKNSSSNKNNNKNDDNSFSLLLQNRWTAADLVELRLDATLVACHVLARFLVYDLTLPAKDVPGMEVTDVIQRLDTFTSAMVLAVLWIFVGLVVTRLFEDAQSWRRLAGTTALAAPLWLLLELVLHWPAAPSSSGIEHVLVGSLGLLGTMSLGRLVPAHMR